MKSWENELEDVPAETAPATPHALASKAAPTATPGSRRFARAPRTRRGASVTAATIASMQQISQVAPGTSRATWRLSICRIAKPYASK